MGEEKNANWALNPEPSFSKATVLITAPITPYREADTGEIPALFLGPVSNHSTAFWINWRVYRDLLGQPNNN